MSDFENSNKPQTSDDQEPAQGKVFEEFCSDLESIESLGVTPQELQTLSRASLLGILNSKEDLTFILRQIRESMKRTASQASAPLGSTQISVREVDAPTRDFGEITETIRRAALAKMTESDSKAGRRGAIAWRRVKMMLRRRNQSSPDYRTT